MAQSKYLIGFLFILALAFIGLVAGTAVGGMFFVPEGSGLAGPAIALGYGVLGVGIAVVLGIVAVRALSLPVLRKVTLVVGAVALVGVGLVAYRIIQSQREAAEQMAAMPPSPYRLPYTMRLDVTEAGRSDATYSLPFRSIEIENELEGGTFELVTAEASPRRCRGPLADLEPVDISSGLQRTAAIVASHYQPCMADTTGTVLHRLHWDLTVDSSLPEGAVDLTSGCLDQQEGEGPRDLVRYLRDLHARVAPTMTCEPLPVGAASTSYPIRQASLSSPEEELPLGVGIVAPLIEAGRWLYFYPEPDLETPAYQLQPKDSVAFVQGEHYVDIAEAPSWFVPEIMKLDYGLLYLRAQTLTQNWIEVVISSGATRWDPRTLWVDRHAVTFTPWPQFLLGVPSVEVLDAASNPIRSGPSDDTAHMGEAGGHLLDVMAVQGPWMKVRASMLEPSEVPTGWIRWNDGKRLLISYSPLS